MKYSLSSFLSVLSNWSDYQFGFSNLCNICPNGQNELVLISDFGHFSFQSKFGLISPNGIANEIALKDKAIEVRREIIRTRLGC